MKEAEAIARGIVEKKIQPTALDYCKEILIKMQDILASALRSSENTATSIDNKLTSVVTQIKSLAVKENTVQVTVDHPDNMDKKILAAIQGMSGQLSQLNLTVRNDRLVRWHYKTRT